METFIQDLRYGLRMLRKSPAFTAVAVLTLALGIGANTAIFSLINAVLLKRLPVKDPKELVFVGDPARANSRNMGTPQADLFSYPMYRVLRDGNTVFSGMMASGEVNRSKVENENGLVTSEATGVLVTGNYFSVLGVGTIMGRTLTEQDDVAKGAHPLAVVSHGFWKDKLSQDPNIIGKTLKLNNYSYTVVGVTPPGFIGDTVGDKQDFWVPMMMQEQMLRGRPWLEEVHASWLRSIARLKPGVSAAQAEANVNVVFKQWLQSPQIKAIDPGDQDVLQRSKVPVAAGGALGFSAVRGDYRQPLLLLMGFVGLVLLIACVNVANLLLARAAVRQREVAVRLAIGAGRARLVRQLLTESVVLALLGGAAGLLAARWATQALLTLSVGARASDGLQVALDWRVLGFTAGLCLLTGLVFGLAPALRATRVAVAPTLKESTLAQGQSGRFPIGKILVAVEVAICLLALFSAGLLLRSLNNLQKLDLGYSRENLLMVRADPVAAGYKVQPFINFQREMTDRLSALPGVRSVTGSENGLFSGTESADVMKIEGYTSDKNQDRLVYWDQVGTNYFKALGVPILRGREFGPQDTPTALRVAVINETMARFYFGNSDPLGKRLWIDDQESRDKPMEIIGVARDMRDHDLRGPVPRRFYVPLGQAPDALFAVNFEIRTAGDPAAMTETVRKAFAAYDPSVPLTRVKTLPELVDGNISLDILLAKLTGFFGLLALLLACLGLYGVMSYTVSRRTREIGLRMALGAQRSQVMTLVLTESMKVVLVGVAAGIPLSLLGSRVFASMLVGLRSTDPLSLGVVVLTLGAIAAIAGWIPALRATRVDPMVALRHE